MKSIIHTAVIHTFYFFTRLFLTPHFGTFSAFCFPDTAGTKAIETLRSK